MTLKISYKICWGFPWLQHDQSDLFLVVSLSVSPLTWNMFCNMLTVVVNYKMTKTFQATVTVVGDLSYETAETAHYKCHTWLCYQGIFGTFKLNSHLKKERVHWFNLPVCFAEVLEVVHVAAGGRVLSIFCFPLFGVSYLQQIAVVLHHILAFLETPSGKHCSPFCFYMLDLQKHKFTLATYC